MSQPVEERELSTQERILEFIKSEIQDKGFPPSVREICTAVGVNSPSTVHGHLVRLEKQGLIRRDPLKPRALEIVGDPAFMRSTVRAVPLLGRIHEPETLLAEQNLEDYISLPDVLLSGGEHFIVRLLDDRMAQADLKRGDYAIVRRCDAVPAGEPAAVLEDDACIISPAEDGKAVQGEVIAMFRLLK